MRDHSPVELVLLVTAALLLAPVVGTVVVSAAPVENDTYAVAQGTSCTVVNPVVDESQNVSAFYDYRNPNTDPPSSTYASHGTREYQETSTSALFFYEGPESASLVLIHDELGDEAGGSTLTMEFDGLPADGDWAVRDDDYEEPDDDWVLGDTTATVDWKWGDNRTDGGAYSGVGNMSGTITITPGFNEDAAHWGDWGYSGSDEYRVNEWRLIDADGDETTLDRDRQLFIHGGVCEETPPTASLTGPSTAETGQSVTLDAGDSTDDGTIGGYEWDLNGDGETDQVTTDPTLDHTFAEEGAYTVAVTAFDTYGNGDTAELAVNVTQPAAPPEAALSAPEQATVNETITLDASASTDDGTISRYEWDFDGDGTVDANTTEPTVDHAYETLGTFDATVTVVDAGGERDSATQQIDVVGPNQPPNASLDAPEVVNENEQVTLDASASTDDRGIDSYRWDFNGDGETDTETVEPTVVHTFENPGNVTVSVTVVDSDGATDRANASIQVQNVDDPPTAALSAPETATVNETVTFDASGSTDDEGVQRYEWDFDGDGTVDANTTEPTVEHVYSTEATDVVATVTVVDTANQTDSATAPLDVVGPNEPPNASLSAPANATVGDAVTFDASASTDDRGIESYRWDFDGDGTVDTETDEPVVDHTYSESGPMTAELVVVDTDGATDRTNATVQVGSANDTPTAALSVPAEVTRNETVTLDASESSDADGIQRYEWDFDGDGTVDANTTEPTVQHAFETAGTYDVTLTVVDIGGRTDTATATTTVVESGTAFSVVLNAPETATVNESVTLEASVSGSGDDGDDDDDAEDVEVERYEWDLNGDGTVDRETDGPTIEHVFADAGSVTVGVTAVGDDGETANASSTLVVSDPNAANASIAVTTTEPTAGEPISFEADTTATNVTSYAWQFGDGATGSGASAQHTYAEAGSYEVTLEVTTAGGVTVSTTTTVTVAEADTGNGGNTGGSTGGTGGGDTDTGDDDSGSSGDDGDSGNSAGGGQQGGGQQGGGQQGGGAAPAEPEPEADIGPANVSLAPERLLTGETLVVEATVTNHGDATGTKTVEFEVEGSMVEERTLTLAPGVQRTVTFRYQFDSPGEKSIQVDHGRKRTVVVEAREPNLTVSALKIDKRQVDTGEPFTLTATVTNNGTAAGDRTIALELFGERVATQSVSVPVGEAVEITFTRSVMAPGSYEAIVGNESVTVEVVGTAATTEPPATDTEAPGFGAVTAVLALLGAVLALRRLD